jgi:HK97 family phage prohead protease
MNQLELEKTFGERLVKLYTGAVGLRGGIKCEVKSLAGDAPILDFVATDETLDRYNEVIKITGWDTKNYLANPVVPDCHNYDSVARILGRTVSLTIADGQMVNRVEFCLDNPLGAMAYKMAKGQFIKSESVGFIPLEWIAGKAGEPDRTFTKQELLEISLVVVPANPGATVGLALKSGAIDRADVAAAADFIKEFCSKKSDSHTSERAPGGEIDGAQLLQICRTFLNK